MLLYYRYLINISQFRKRGKIKKPLSSRVVTVRHPLYRDLNPEDRKTGMPLRGGGREGDSAAKVKVGIFLDLQFSFGDTAAGVMDLTELCFSACLRHGMHLSAMPAGSADPCVSQFHTSVTKYP